MTHRFKIDLSGSSVLMFALFFNRGGWFNRWEIVRHCDSKDEARAIYEKVKDLPEYLP